MAETTLALASLATYLVGLTYAFVAYRLTTHARQAPASRRPMLYFAFWWGATGLNQILGATLYLAASLGHTDLTLQLAYVLLQRLLLALSLVGLMYYLLSLHLGRGFLVPLLAFYSLYWVTQVYSVLARQPIGVESFGWRTDLVYALQLAPAFALVNLAILVPPVLGALLLLRLYRRIEDRTRRFRVAMLAGGFTIWWIVAIVAGQPATFDNTFLQITNRAVGIAVALGILLAYQPLPWMQERYHLQTDKA